MDLVLRAVESDDEVRLANDLMAKTHNPVYFDSIRWLETHGAGYPAYQREHTRIALWNGEIAAALRVTTDTIRIGEARLKMGGFGWVSTAPAHRHKGIGRELMLHTLKYLSDHQFHVSMLFGIPNFYHRFGFTTTLADYAIAVDVLDASVAAHPPYKVRDGKPGDIRAMQKMHAANDAETACSIIRTAAHFTNKWERWKPVQVLTDERGKVIGYFLPQPGNGELVIAEIGAADRAACGAVLHACARRAIDEFAARIRVQTPPMHPVARYLLEFKSTHEMRLSRDSGGMMAFVNTGETLECLLPEWESRLQRSALCDARTEVTLYDDKRPFRVRANRGALDIALAAGPNKVSLRGGGLMHLVTGYRYLEDVLAAQRRVIAPEARGLLAVLFPKRTPFVWPLDRF